MAEKKTIFSFLSKELKLQEAKAQRSEADEQFGEEAVPQEVELQRMRMPATNLLPREVPVSRARNIFLPPTENINQPSFLRSFETFRTLGSGNESDSTPAFDVQTKVKEIDFMDVVDEDETQAYEDVVAELFCGKLVESIPFRLTVLAAILLNTVLERFLNRWMQGLDAVFLTMFSLEILLKWYHNFLMFWQVGWNVFDFFLVAISIVGLDFLRSGRVLRIFRVLRAFRSLRSISALKGLQTVVQTILRSLPDMANIVALLLIVNFIFAVTGVDLFGKGAPEHFGSIGKAMFTLFIAMTQDGWVQTYNEIKASTGELVTALYFTVYVIVGALVFANIIVGVTVTNLQLQYKEMKEAKLIKHRVLEENRDMWAQNPFTKYQRTPGPGKLHFKPLENYYLLLVAIENNLTRHQDLRQRLRSVIAKVERLNKNITRADSDSDSDSDVEQDIGALEKHEEEDGDQTKDALTLMFAMEKAKENMARQKRLSATMRHRWSMQKKLLQEPETASAAPTTDWPDVKEDVIMDQPQIGLELDEQRDSWVESIDGEQSFSEFDG